MSEVVTPTMRARVGLALILGPASPSLALAKERGGPLRASASNRPVTIESIVNINACETIAVVRASANSNVAVHAGPSVKAKQIDRLAAGAQVYVCDGTADGGWTGVVYRPGGGRAARCWVEVPIAKTRSYRGPCKSGWIVRRRLRVIAG